MKPRRLLSLLAAAALAGSTLGVPGASLPHARAAATYSMIMNWFPEPEVGGYYAADSLGYYKQAGLDFKINEFGYSVQPIQYVLSGRATFGMANADEILLARARGAKVVAVMATFQINDQALMWHAEDTTIKGVGDLSNHTLVYSFGGGYEPYLVQKYNYTNFKTRNYDFTLRYFATHKDAVNQAYATSEPYQAQQMGIKVKYALIADSGYSPYGDLIFTTEDMIKNHPDAVKAFVASSVKGWYHYLKSPDATNTYLKTAPGAKNFPLTPGNMTYSWATEKKLNLIDGGEAKTHGIGYFSLTRWQTLQKQMIGVKVKPNISALDVTNAFTNQFVPAMGAM